MTTPEMFMWAATALNIGGVCYSAWLIRRHNRLHGNLVDMSKELIEALENELQKRVELTMDVMRLTSEMNELREGAAFEERVAKRLSHPWLNNVCDLDGCHVTESCSWCRLKTARLKVEEEMDGCRR